MSFFTACYKGILAESDPVFAGHVAYGITSTNISNWNSAYGWGNHASAGYLTVESDPVFTGHVAYGITSTKISNWDSAYGWGNHASAGYLTSFTESDPVFTGQKGAANGVCPLDASTKIDVAYLPNSVMEYQGTYNATTNSPSLTNGTGNQGDVYIVSVAGTRDFGAGNISFLVGDFVIYSGSIYQRSPSAYEPANANIQGHISTVSGNPHAVTKTEVGLSNVTNDAQIKAADLDTNVALGTSDTKVPSQNAVKTYVDSIVRSDFIGGMIEEPDDKDYVLDQKAPFSYTISSLTVRSGASGTAHATIKIDSTAIYGLEDVDVSGVENQDDAVSGNVVPAGATVILEISDNAAADDLGFTLAITVP